jgi:glycosyltransferase involved in cell wall biosynthesis
MKWWDQDHDPVIDGTPYRAISKKLPMYTAKGQRSILQGIKFGFATLNLIRVRKLEAIEADQIPYLQLFPLWIICKAKRIPLIVTWHEYWGFKYWRMYLPGIQGLIGGILENISARLPSHIIAVSEESANRLSVAIGTRKRISIIMSGLPLREMASIPNSEVKQKIVYVGRLQKHKRVDLLIEAYRLVKRDPQFRKLGLQIIGSGPLEQELQDNAKDLPNCVFSGDISTNTDVWAAVKNAKVLVLPSEREGYGMVVAESLALGTPTITSNHLNNAARHLTDNQPGAYLFNAGSVSDLAKQIKKSLSEDVPQATVSEVFIANHPSFDWDVMVQQYADLVSRLTRP